MLYFYIIIVLTTIVLSCYAFYQCGLHIEIMPIFIIPIIFTIYLLRLYIREIDHRHIKNNKNQKETNKVVKQLEIPDMREKVKEYIKELETEIDRLEDVLKPSNRMSNIDRATILSRIDTLLEVKTDLTNRLEELI